MKYLLHTFLICFLTLSGMINLSAQIKLDFSAQFYPQQIDKIYLHTDAPVQYVTTNSELVTIEINVLTNTRKHRVIDCLVEQGRYNVNAKVNGTVMNLRMPNLAKLIRINQKDLEETITYKVYVPKGIQLAQYKKEQKNWEQTELLAAK